MDDHTMERNLQRLLRSAGDDVRPSEAFHRRTFARILDEFRAQTGDTAAGPVGAHLIRVLDRYEETHLRRTRVRRWAQRYWPVAAAAAAVVAMSVLMPASLPMTPTSTVELRRARTAILEADDPAVLAVAAPHFQQALVRSQVSGAMPARRIMDLEFLRYVASHATDIDQRGDLLFLLDAVAADHESGPRMPSWLGMSSAHADTPEPGYVQLLYAGRFREAAKALEGDDRVTARFTRSWALKEAGEYETSRAVLAGLLDELRPGSLIDPVLPRAMIAYSFLWEGRMGEGMDRLTDAAEAEPYLHFQEGYLRRHFMGDDVSARRVWTQLPPGNLRSYALAQLAPPADGPPAVSSAYFTERAVLDRESCVALVIRGRNLDLWTRITVNGTEITRTETAGNELVIPLTHRPTGALQLDIVTPHGTLHRTLHGR